MNVTYKCRCMAEEVTIAVADRTEGQDVVDWVSGTVGRAIGADHRGRSPRCLSSTCEYIKFEVDPSGNTPMGTLPRQ